MEKQKQTLAIEADDFITPKKAITISTISLVIWFVTGLSFKLLHVFIPDLPYEGYALVMSLSLSVIFSIYIVKKLVSKSDLIMKIILGVLNTMLIYTSANGAQATYGFLSSADKKDDTNKTAMVSHASLIPFLDARPWIPDKILRAENETLKDEILKMKAENDWLLKQNEILKDSVNNPPKVTDNSNTRNLQDSLKIYKVLLSNCQKNNPKISDQWEALQERVRQFNSRQSKWRQLAKEDKTQAKIMAMTNRQILQIKQEVNKLMKDPAYYDFLFLTPISLK